jgi:hypothetical protein
MGVEGHGHMMLAGKTKELGGKPAPLPLHSPHILHGLMAVHLTSVLQDLSYFVFTLLTREAALLTTTFLMLISLDFKIISLYMQLNYLVKIF